KAGQCKVSPPIVIPEGKEWCVRIIGSSNRFVFGVYRRHLKTIGYLGKLDELFGAPTTTRRWKPKNSARRVLKGWETTFARPPERSKSHLTAICTVPKIW